MNRLQKEKGFMRPNAMTSRLSKRERSSRRGLDKRYPILFIVKFMQVRSNSIVGSCRLLGLTQKSGFRQRDRDDQCLLWETRQQWPYFGDSISIECCSTVVPKDTIIIRVKLPGSFVRCVSEPDDLVKTCKPRTSLHRHSLSSAENGKYLANFRFGGLGGRIERRRERVKEY